MESLHRVGTPLPAPPLPAPDWALFLDVDGSLLEFAAHPAGVRVPDGLEQDILALGARLDGAVALVSGRDLAMLDALFPALRTLPAAGLHGLERRDADGALHAPPEPPALLDALQAMGQALAKGHPGAVVERKGPNLAVHWRAAPGAEAVLRDFAEAALGRLSGYRLQSGDRVLELRPDGDSDKGAAVRAFLAEAPFRGRTPVFVGDDLTDEHAFAAVNAHGGISVLVGGRAGSQAVTALPDPRAVGAWLQAGARALAPATTAGAQA